MPLTGAKRGRPAADEGAKRRKLVADAVKEADGLLPDAVLTMLGAAVPGSLGVPPEERDAYQKAFVEMVESLLKDQEAALKNGVRDSESGVATAASSAAACFTEAKGLEEALTAKEEDITGKDGKLSEDKAAAKTRGSELQAATAAQASLSDEIEKAKGEKDTFEKLKNEHFVVLRDSPPSHKAGVKKHIGVLVKTLTPLDVEEALLLGIPITLAKGPDERSTFDKMLVDYLATILDGQVAKCESCIAASGEEAAARAAAVEAAQGAVDAAKAQQSASSEALEAAEGERKELQARLKEAQKKVKEQAKDAKQAEQGKADADSALADFAEVLAAFAAERDPPAAPPAEAEAETEAPHA